MKRFAVYLYVFAFYVFTFLVGAKASAMSAFAESAQLAALPGVDRHAILVEVKTSAAGTLQTLQLPTTTAFRVEPTFSPATSSQLQALTALPVQNYYYVIFQNSLSADEATAVLRYLNSQPQIRRAYLEPTVSDPIAHPIQKPTPSALAVFKMFSLDLAVPNFESKQIYLEAAPKGLDARYSWTLAGGDGKGVRFADVETGWHTEHHEFNPAFYDNGKNGRVDHGTAVWGIVAARNDGIGTTGIANAVDFATCATGTGLPNPPEGDYYTLLSRAIGEATAQLRPGDVLLVEQHQMGPDNSKFAPVEYNTPVFELLKAATDRGVHCIEAAGNGSSNLDVAAYQGAFDIKVRDSGCIIVGAGGSPEGTTPLEKLDFSDYGTRVDAFAYGEMVTSTGYGDLFGGDDTTIQYTSDFNGTSSATPMVASVVADLAGIARAKGVILTPAQVRAALHETGTPQAGDTSENIGRMPDLRALTAKLFR